MRIAVLLTAIVSAAVPVTAQTMSSIAPAPDALGPKSVVPAVVACADRPTTSIPVSTLRIVAPHAGDRHADSVGGHLVVLNAGTAQGLMAGQQFFTRRVQPPVSGDPISVATPGSIRTSGWLTVVAADADRALARIDYACTAIESGDYLEPYEPTILPTAVGTGGRTDFTDLGRVLFGVDRRETFGPGDVLSIDRGSSRGVIKGTRLAFYRARGGNLPLVELGTGIVVEVATDSAKVILDRSSEDVRRGDYFGLRATP